MKERPSRPSSISIIQQGPFLPPVIALCGRKRAGKNTAADALRTAFHTYYSVEGEMAIADPIKRCVGNLFGFSERQLDGDQKEVPDHRWDGVTPRRVLQFFGTEMMQHKLQELLPGVGRYFWTRALITRIRNFLLSRSPSSKQGIIITDVRFLHEQEELRRELERKDGRRVCFVKILRPELVNDESEHASHASETDVDRLEADVVIENRSPSMSEEDFRRACIERVGYWLGTLSDQELCASSDSCSILHSSE